MGRSSITFTTKTSFDKESLKKLNQILTCLFENGDSFEFRQPVDYKALGLIDYPNVIKNPMDLGTVKKKLTADKYQFIEEVLDDIMLGWDNCKGYNAEGSWIWKLSDKLEKYFKKLIKNYLPHITIVQAPLLKPQGSQSMRLNDSGQVGGDIYTGDDELDTLQFKDKQEFSKSIKTLSPQQLGVVVQIIQNNCGKSFKEIEDEKCQILVDNLDNNTFNKIMNQIKQWQQLGDNVSKKVKTN